MLYVSKQNHRPGINNYVRLIRQLSKLVVLLSFCLVSCHGWSAVKTYAAGNKTDLSNIYSFSAGDTRMPMLLSSHLSKNSIDEDSTNECTAHNDSIKIYNFTHYDLNDIVLWGCDYLGIKNVWVNIIYLYHSPIQGGMVAPGKMMLRGKNGYNLYLKRDLNDRQVDLIVIHELIHIQQYQAQKIKLTGNIRVVTYNGEKINLKKVPYNLRVYEEEAHTLDNKILGIYYKKAK